MDTEQITTDALLDVMHKGDAFRVRYTDGYVGFTPEHDYDAEQRVVVALWTAEFSGAGGAVRGTLVACRDAGLHHYEDMLTALLHLLGDPCEVTS